MRVEYTQSGGVVFAPGLQKPVVIDADQLEPADREAIEKLVHDARFFELPAVLGATPKGAADYQYKTLSIDHDGRRHTVKFMAPVEDTAVGELLQKVEAHVKAARRQLRAAAGPAPSAP